MTRVLLVEDNPDHLYLISSALAEGRPETRIVVASSRCEMIEVAGRHSFDCVLLDYHIAHDEAPELIAELRPLLGETPIVAMSSAQDNTPVILAVRSGVRDFITKPDAFHSERLWERLDEVIASHRRGLAERRRTNRRLLALERAASTDQLTGLSNRRAVESWLSRDRRHHERRQWLGVVLFDIDHFKAVNDTLGHAEGDSVLKEVASVIQGSADAVDLVGRWGGEEFVVLRQSATLVETWIFAERVRRAVEAQVTPRAGLGRVRVSAGVDVVSTDGRMSDVLAGADRALYLAKDTGRNRVCSRVMADVHSLACTLSVDDDVSAADRLRSLTARLAPTLGPLQREHVGTHGRDVRDVVGRFLQTVRVTGTTAEDLLVAAEFHDVGKLGVPECLLAAPRRLSREERWFVDCHAGFGAELLAACGGSAESCRAVASHHDRFDDIGRGVKGESDVRAADVLSAADALVAMRSTRPYSRAMTEAAAHKELSRCAGTVFHPTVVQGLLVSESKRTGRTCSAVRDSVVVVELAERNAAA